MVLMEPVIACIDVGNSRTHLGLVKGQELLCQTHVATRDFEADTRAWLDGQSFDGLAWCSVVPAKNPTVAAIAAEHNRPFHLRHDDCPGLKISYPKPAEIGQDRLASAIGAQMLCGAPAIVLDAGTAVTFEAILPQEGYIGGLIAPGLAMLSDYLHEKTAQLPAVPLDKLSAEAPFGSSTAESMMLACAVGFDGMIAALTRRIQRELAQRGHPEPAMLATGGSIQHLLEERDHWQWIPGLTLLGLAEAWRRKMTLP